MKLIAVDSNIMVNPDKIISVEMIDKKMNINLEEGYSYEVKIAHKEFLSILSKSGYDITKQFLSV